jgi:hypothetical protein
MRRINDKIKVCGAAGTGPDIFQQAGSRKQQLW